MIIEVCLVLKIILNENQDFSVEQLNVSPCKATNEPATTKNIRHTISNDMANMDFDASNPGINSHWAYRPATQLQESQMPHENVKQVVMKSPHSLTRLAKTLTLGFDPYFSKGYFEPFERRPKPVTLVAFRKNGLMPASRNKMANDKSAEIAELQSSFNDVSNFWIDD